MPGSPRRPTRWRVPSILLLAALALGACDSTERNNPTASGFVPTLTTFPLQIGADKRTLYDGDGRRFTLHGEAAWSLVVQLSPTEVEQYLENRRQKGFNSIYVNLIEHKYSSNTPPWRNRQGDLPFAATLPSGSMDFGQPDEAYWSHVDFVIDTAAAKGIFVIAFPSYVGYQFNDSGWAQEMLDNGVDACRAYGEWLGARYGDRTNLMWSMGGDWAPQYGGRSVSAHFDALASGIETTAPSHWITAHSSRDRSALDDYAASWLDLNTTYASYIPSANDVTVPAELRDGHAHSGPRPFFFIEGQYENEYETPLLGIRSQAYWSILAGAAGHFYGNNPVWAFASADRFADDPSVTWQQGLELPGVQDMVRVAQFLQDYVDQILVPDETKLILKSAEGSLTGTDFVACAFTPDCMRVLVYTPIRQTLILDLTLFEGSPGRARWFNPRTGITTDPVDLPNTAAHVPFTPPGEGDWLLIVDDTAPNTGGGLQ